MRLKYLELYGFKSFAEKTRLSFDDNFACIVGPNGSGKSNIADAIRWVLGEQSAKELRGAKMEDVIFSGTQWKKAMNMAQVTLGLDNSDGSLGLSYDELTISRKVYRSGESEYLINKMPVRRRDIRELFMDTGIGRAGYSLIGQGKIEELLSSRGEDRRAVFDEASGIAKYKYKKEESLKRLEKTEKSLSEVEVEIRGKEQEEKILKKQAENARLGLKLTQDLEIHELSLLKNRLDQAKQEIGKYQAEKEKLEEDGNRLKKEREKLEEGLNPSREALSFNIQSRDKLQRKIQQLKDEIQKRRSEARLQEEQLHFYRRDQEKLREKVQKNKEQEDDLFCTELESKKNIEALKSQIAQLQSNQSKVLENDEKKDESVSFQLEEAQKNRDLIRKKLSFLDYEQRRKEEEARTFTQLQERKKEEFSALMGEKENIQSKINKNQDQRQCAQRAEEKAKELLEALILEEKGLAEKQNQWDREWVEREKKMAGLSSRLDFLQSLIDHFEGYTRAVQDLLRLSSKNPDLSSRMRGTLASQVEVHPPYENAIDAALGGSLQNIVVPSQGDGKFLMDLLKKENIGRVTFLPMDKIQGKVPVSSADQRILCNGVDALTYAKDLRSIIEHFLSNTVIVRDLSDAISLSKSFRGVRMITLDGEIINSWGSMVGGKIFHRNEASLINRQTQKRKLEEEIHRLENEKKLAFAVQKQIEEKKEENKKAFLIRNQELEKARSEVEECKANELDLLSDVKILEAEIQKIKDFLSEDQLFLKEEFDEKRKTLEEEKEKAEEACRILQAAWQNEQGKKAEEEKKSALLKEKLAYLSRDLGLAENHYHDLLEKREASQLESREAENDLQELAKQIEDKKAFLQESDGLLKNWNQALHMAIQEKEQADAQENSLQSKVDAILQKRTRLLEQESEQEKELFENQIHLDQWQSKEKETRDEYCTAYDLSLDTLDQKLKNLSPVKTSRSKVNEIKKDLSQIGYFHFQSIEEYEKLSEELDFLHRQVEDLKKSKKDILLLIQNLNQTMIQLFEENFKAINQSFNEVFSILFDGGKARLELDRPDVLAANIDIVAQPPHKKLQSLELLSGGERSMTALALLFAIFSIHPTPFCVLDEIDAALDEANTGRYGHFLLTLTEKTQFVIITHRKSTMELADVLYGVTMEKGISQVISLKFDDYRSGSKEEIRYGLL